jgi:8-oxo-dGTP diphosphatase
VRLGSRVPGADHIWRPGAYAVIFGESDRIACIRTEFGLFLPGGGLEGDETPEVAVVREALEEAGLRVEVTGSLGTVEEYHSSRDGTEHWLLESTFFRCRVVDMTVYPSEEDHVLEWVPVKKAAAAMVRESHRWVLKKGVRPHFRDASS